MPSPSVFTMMPPLPFTSLSSALKSALISASAFVSPSFS
jgi:hypothetical protein